MSDVQNTEIVAEGTEVKATRTKRVFSNEEIVAMETTVENVAPLLSENTAKLVKMASAWYTEGKKDAIAEAIVDFGTEDELRAFAKSEELQGEIGALENIAELVKVMKSMVTMFGKEKKARKPRLKKGGKKISISIEGKGLFQVNAEYFESIKDITNKEEKIALIEAHPSFTKVEQIEVL